MKRVLRCAVVCLVVLPGTLPAPAFARQAEQPPPPSRQAALNGAAGSARPAIPLPPGYVIGVQDILSIVFFREKEMSAEVVVRPDGKISLPLVNDLQAAGLTPEELNLKVEEAAARYVRGAEATVIVKEIRSRKVFVVGEVVRPGTVHLSGDMNVLQVIAEVGGFLEHARKGDVVIVRTDNGHEQRLKFNYNDVVKGKSTEQNILLRPGDTIVVR